MRSLLDDWVDVFEGNAVFDKSHFLALFKEHKSIEELNIILQYFSRRQELVQVIQAVLSAGSFEDSLYLLPKNRASTDKLLAMAAQAWIDELAAYFELRNVEFYGICRSADVTIVELDVLNLYRGKDIPTYWIFEELSDDVFSSVTADCDRLYYLQEALYGIAADYYLSFYMMHPLFDPSINFRKYFDFWRVGGCGYLTKEKFFISSVNND